MAGRSQKFAKQAATLAAQASAGRKAQEGLREPRGRLSRAAKKVVGADSVNEIYRVRAAALAGAGDPRWGTQLGRLFLEGKISGEQYGAGRSWDAVMERWRRVILAPPFNPRCGLGSLYQPDPTEPKKPGRKYEVTVDMDEQDAAVILMVNEVIEVFARGAADPQLVAVRECVEQDLAPVGYGGMLLLVEGLDRLAEHWNVEG